MLSSSLLGNGYDKEPMSTTSDEAHPLETSRMHQKKVIPAYLYYGLIALASFSTLLLIIVSIAWAAEKPKEETVVPVYSSTSAPFPSSTPLPPTQAATSTPAWPTSTPYPIGATSSSAMQPSGPADLPNVLLPSVYPGAGYSPNSWPGQVKTWNLLHHLSGLYSIAMENGGNRVIGSTGFNSTVDYLLRVIREQTNLVNIERSYFQYANAITVTSSYFGANFEMLKAPVNYTYGVDWRVPVYSRAGDGATAVVLLVYGGCQQSDYDDAVGPEPPVPFYFLVPQNASCSDANKIGFAQYSGASGLIIQGLTSTLPTATRAPWVTTITVVYMANNTAQAMVDAIKFGGSAAVMINLWFQATQNDILISNICADTPTGDPTSVVLVGGHSDGVARGPGTNDDGSGSISTLVLALALTKLMRNTTVPYNPPNMIKFCWFGGEEAGLLGSYEVVRVGLERDRDPNARPGSKARDWAIMVDLDMLGSLNFVNWVYDANTYIPPTTPTRAWQGSKLLSNLFFEFFDNNTLPRDSERFDGRSDYGPFLLAGVPAGGVYAGADKRKTEEQRLRYQSMTGWGGITGVINDQCYHQACDTIANIHWGVYTNQTQSAAYVMEKLAMRRDLRAWLGNPLDRVEEEGEQGTVAHLDFAFRVGGLPKTVEELALEEELGLRQ